MNCWTLLEELCFYSVVMISGFSISAISPYLVSYMFQLLTRARGDHTTGGTLPLGDHTTGGRLANWGPDHIFPQFVLPHTSNDLMNLVPAFSPFQRFHGRGGELRHLTRSPAVRRTSAVSPAAAQRLAPGRTTPRGCLAGDME